MTQQSDSGDLLEQAVAAHGAGRFAEAETLYRSLLEADSSQPDANHNLGVLEAQAGRLAEAIRLFRHALQGNPQHPQYWTSLIRALHAAGDFAAARLTLDEARRRGVGGDAIQRLEVSVRASPRNNIPTGSTPDTVIALLNAGRYDEMEAAALRLTQHRKADAFGWNLLGIARLMSGKTADAEAPLRQAIKLHPSFAEAHCNLGRVLTELGRKEEAVTALRRALTLKPGFPEALNNLGLVLVDIGRSEEAVTHLRDAVHLQPSDARSHSNLGLALITLGRGAEAISNLHQALALNPRFPEAYFNLGNAMAILDRRDESVAAYRAALSLRPDYVDAWFGLGSMLASTNRTDDAIESYRRTLEYQPTHTDAWLGLGNAYLQREQPEDAVIPFRRALALNPDHIEGLVGLGRSLMEARRFGQEAQSVLQHALAMDPASARAHALMGSCFQQSGRHDRAIASFRKALEVKPDYEDVFGSLLFALNYHPDKSGEEIYEAYREYDERFGKPQRAGWREHGNSREVGRRLKVGYVSPDFNIHAVTNFLEPLLASHDKAAVEVYAYAELKREDEVTARYRSYVDHWLATRGMTDDALAERIRADGIDILVDVAGHTAGNRLEVFARKPAPVSVSWLGYSYTTGLSAIDYFLTDTTCAPEGSEGLFAETPWRLAVPSLVYRPTLGMGEVSALPALERGQVTFGTLTRAVRINHRTIRVWAEILKQVPRSRLVIDSRNFQDDALRESLEGQFAEHGIGRERLEIGFHSPPWEVLRGMDIGLDCFPHNSGTTLFETLYMGVPYVTLAGRPSVGRLGGSILVGAGHPEWIARSEAEYIEKAVALASDLPKLAEIRSRLRGEMADGPLLDEAGFARHVEAAYRDMFGRWASQVADQ